MTETTLWVLTFNDQLLSLHGSFASALGGAEAWVSGQAPDLGLGLWKEVVDNRGVFRADFGHDSHLYLRRQVVEHPSDLAI